MKNYKIKTSFVGNKGYKFYNLYFYIRKKIVYKTMLYTIFGMAEKQF